MTSIKELLSNWKYRGLYVDLDPSDTSITLSKKLFAHMGVMKQQQAKVIVFFVHDSVAGDVYGFELNPPLPKDSDTPIADIQYNSKHKCAGFETLVPTVARILFDYHLPNNPVRLKVLPHTVQNRTVYIILPPKQ